MAVLLPPEEFVQLYLKRGLLSKDDLIKHSVTGELLPDVQITPLMKKEANDVRVYIKDTFYDPTIVKEMLGPTRDALWEEAKKKRVFTRIAPLCRAISLSSNVMCERVPYQYVRLIHSNADYVLRERGLYEPTYLRDALWSLVMRNGSIVPLEKSVLPNALSVHILTVGRDGAAVLVLRSPRLSIAANTYSVIEGYVEADRDNKVVTGEDLAYIELEDEAGLKPGEMDLYYIGAFRSLRTLGRPMMLFIGIYKGSAAELAKRIEAVGSWEHSGVALVKFSWSAKDIDDFFESLEPEMIEVFPDAEAKRLSPTMKLYTHILGLILRNGFH